MLRKKNAPLSVRHVILCVGLLVLAACTSRQRLTPPYPARFPVDQKVEVWRRGERVLLRHVTIDSAAVNGMALPWRPRCDSCTVAIPRAEADSLVLLHSTATEVTGILGTTAIVSLVWLLNDCRPFFPRCSE
jgi:hypothetical protein